jgi:TRAP-type C4-dicarboxylate transport system permease small subunit
VRVVLAPNWLTAAARSLLLLAAMLLVGAIMLGAKGPPRSSRDVRRDEIARFAPRVVPGVAQLGGQLLLVVVLTWACGGALKIRL